MANLATLANRFLGCQVELAEAWSINPPLSQTDG